MVNVGKYTSPMDGMGKDVAVNKALIQITRAEACETMVYHHHVDPRESDSLFRGQEVLPPKLHIP